MDTSGIFTYQGKDKKQEPSSIDMSSVLYNPPTYNERLVPLAVPANPQHAETKKRPFDWFILSVVGCLCFPFTGLCAMYYACRANHGVDWKLDETLVSGHTMKAKILTIFSIVFGVIISLVLIVTTVMLVRSACGTYYDYYYQDDRYPSDYGYVETTPMRPIEYDMDN